MKQTAEEDARTSSVGRIRLLRSTMTIFLAVVCGCSPLGGITLPRLPDLNSGGYSGRLHKYAYWNYAGQDRASDEVAVLWSPPGFKLESIDGLLPDNGPTVKLSFFESHLQPGTHTVTASFEMAISSSGGITRVARGGPSSWTYPFAKGRVYRLEAIPDPLSLRGSGRGRRWTMTLVEVGGIEEAVCSNAFDVHPMRDNWKEYIEERCDQRQMNEPNNGSEALNSETVQAADAGRSEGGTSAVRIQYAVGKWLLPNASPVVVEIDSGKRVQFLPNSQATWTVSEGKHLLKIIDPEKGFMHYPDWKDYATVLDLTGVALPSIRIEPAAAPFGFGPLFYLTVLSGNNEIKKEEIHR